MTPERRSNIVQKIIKVLIEQLKLNRPNFFVADRILKDVLEPELEKVKDEYVRLFYSNDRDKH